MLNEEEHLLICLIEECAEVSKECAKALRFGLDDRDPTIENAPRQRVRISQEFDDLLVVADMLFERRTIPLNNSRAEAMNAKRAKVLRFMTYAREHGTLQ